ncbi:entericidin A/B family lipoprotein [Pectobacteriaceae bacterium CE70]|uniref:Entericidin, EcnA/B family n=1 Tax=Serratia sp. (strain ATCC 39006) TaxID=104623 RepID=A0A2I5TH38_SERS3|nr:MULTISPECIES: entericidin A/B family lipoprotein [Enterobacterales]WJV57518.1 entericidin A/B family lipoprotein [Pectobacteriaceae bacterium C111]WJV61851.1 entericidin A/B family lipoprotein [Pectobacteriaceae bacterium C52]WJV66121.1 entericidin A/B family lipoprotein [Pectobacteriaceae bacterium CE70]WJY10135.1 entericidin A/B family lipoprotein [Pectobacteriaceae bacterium C80]WJY15813.1 entericidin A/B family lipoprotein [Pectobacteriaceae bacterium CE90]
MKIMKLLAVVLLMTTTLSGCNTTRGFGQDVEKLGSKISHSAS